MLVAILLFLVLVIAWILAELIGSEEQRVVIRGALRSFLPVDM
jgi:hypothetical protein